jgi:thioredoxin reductase (NADPH)
MATSFDSSTPYDVAIIGGGVSGFGAALYAGRFELKTIVFAELPGGTITLTDDVENYPGFPKISGFDLAIAIKSHAELYPIELREEKVTSVLHKGNLFSIAGPSGTITSKTVIFATGTEWRKLKVPGEEEYTSKGVHYCALCDGAFYKGKTLGVVGGSDSAAKDALLLTQYAKKVYIIYRREKIHPEPITMSRVEKNSKLEIINNTNITEIKGEAGRVTHVLLDKPYQGSKTFMLDGVFVEIGHLPLSALAKSIGVATNKKDEITIDRDAKTNVPGVFAAGDVVDTSFKQAITGVAEGVLAANSAYNYLEEHNSHA